MISIKYDKEFSISDLKNISSTTLAFVGDAYFSLLVRTSLVNYINAKPVKLHKLTTSFVNAEAQSKILESILPRLTEEEISVVRRARNAFNNTKSKNYGLADYKKSTGFEALIGYLYLKKEEDRIKDLLKNIFDNLGDVKC